MISRMSISKIFYITAYLVFFLRVEAQLANPDYYSLFQQSGSRPTRLIDSNGTILHEWPNVELSAHSGAVAYLREDGLLLRSGQRAGGASGLLPGSFGTLQLVEWDGDVVWEFDLQMEGLTLHHDLSLIHI